tara:strand:- start:1209 stop:1823 length:615 start_codon:yes stop_codon:yes gene_type:complete
MNDIDTSKILLIGNSYSLPSIWVDKPWPWQLGLSNRIEDRGATLDYQAEVIINEPQENYDYLIWLVGHHLRADPRANKEFILPYDWAEGDVWGELTRKLWFKKFTRLSWYKRIALLSVLSVLYHVPQEKLLLVPIYHWNILEHDMLKDNPSIWWHFLFKYRESDPDGTGHPNQKGHDKIAKEFQKEIYDRWKISLTLNGNFVSN